MPSPSLAVRVGEMPVAPGPGQIGSPGLLLGSTGDPQPLSTLESPDFSPCVSTAARLFMEIWARAEPAVVPPARRSGHAAPSGRGAAAAGPPGLSRERREEEAPAAEQELEPRQRAARRTQYYGCVLLCAQ
ncbi:hypothetical protein P7K49_035553 [Saguinus oedipus]|uniref:Uncharacterized protein n=1 Tax=Saguinus oedipus TaxID=9490 RepID=A0ABQ9TN20_SAGOE|nr:hypothetical protein P7K49_035553 [Saguinus oedipus]